MRIGIRLEHVDTLSGERPGFVTGDELIAQGWARALGQEPGVDDVRVFGMREAPPAGLTHVVHFQPGMPLVPGARNVCYLQNAFPPETFAGGTVGVFRAFARLYDGWLFPSARLRAACGGEGAVVPFATDPARYCPAPWALAQPYLVTFCGNDIRGGECNARYLEPALPFGLRVFGGGWQGALGAACDGKLPAAQLPLLYSNSHINVNAHIPEHAKNDVVNLRVFDILACGGFCVSDPVESLSEWLGASVVTTTGGPDLADKLRHYLARPEERARIAARGRQEVLAAHTYAHRMPAVVDWLRQ